MQQPARFTTLAAVLILCITASPSFSQDTSPYLLGTWEAGVYTTTGVITITYQDITDWQIANPTTRELDVYAVFSSSNGQFLACTATSIPPNGVGSLATWWNDDPYAVGTVKFFAFPRGTRKFDPNAVIGGFQQEIVPPEAQTVQLLHQDFETDWPPANWTVTDDVVDSPVFWHRSDQPPNYGANLGAPISGLHAYVDSFPACCITPYDTSLIAPSFSTMGMDSVELRFDYQFHFSYSQISLDLDYSTDDGSSWVTLESLVQTPGSNTAVSWTVDISVTKGYPSVQLRWRFYLLYYEYGYANLDNVQVTGAKPGVCHVMDMNLKAVTVNSYTLGEFTWLNDRLKTQGCTIWEPPVPNPVPGTSFCPAPGPIEAIIVPGPFN